MDINEIMQLIDKVSDSKLSEFTLEEGNIKLTLKADRDKKVVYQEEKVEKQEEQEVVVKKPSMPPVQPPMTAQEVSEKAKPVNGKVVKSPLVGTFNSAPEEDKPPYVSVVDTVKKCQVIGIVESMKLMNEVLSEFDGTVLEVLVSNEQMVEYGQPLVVIG